MLAYRHWSQRILANPCCGLPHSRNRPITLSSTRRPNRPPAFSSGACLAAHWYSAVAHGLRGR